MAKKKADLLKYLSKVKAPRRLQGQRHELSNLLLITIMSIMSGYSGYRAMGDFIERNGKELLAVLHPYKDRLPGFDTIRKVLMSLDFDKLSKLFYDWAVQYVVIEKNEWIGIDGKAIGGTVRHTGTMDLSFVSLVSLYCSKKKMILGNAKVSTSKKQEIGTVQQLIQSLDL